MAFSEMPSMSFTPEEYNEERDSYEQESSYNSSLSNSIQHSSNGSGGGGGGGSLTDNVTHSSTISSTASRISSQTQRNHSYQRQQESSSTISDRSQRSTNRSDQHRQHQHHHHHHSSSSDETPEVVFALAKAVAGVVATAALLFLSVIMIFVKTLLMNSISKYGMFSLVIATACIITALAFPMGIPFELIRRIFLGALS